MTDSTEELYKAHRPTTFKRVLGQDAAIASLSAMGKANNIPHTILLTGPSGTGKTTIARILRHKLKCSDVDFTEMNAASYRGIDMVREIQRAMTLAPMASPCRVWLIDEVHQLTAPAQDAILKILEDTPSHVYFILCTTDPQKLKKTIRTRCTDIKTQNLTADDVQRLVERTVDDEDADPLHKDVLQAIVDGADGSARKALVLLHPVLQLDTKDEQLASIKAGASDDTEGIMLARLMLSGKTTWPEMAAAIKTCKEDPEALRWMVLGYATTVLLSSKRAQAAAMIAAFRDNFYDSKKAGLVLACYEVIEG